MLSPDEIRAELERLSQRMEELRRELLVSTPPPPMVVHRRKKHLGVIRGGAAAFAALAPVSWIRQYAGATAVVAATGVALTLMPSLAPYHQPLPPQAGTSAPERPQADGQHRGDRAGEPRSPARLPRPTDPTDATTTVPSAPETTTTIAPSIAPTPEPTPEPTPTPGPGERRGPAPTTEEPRRPCLTVDVPPHVNLPACVEEVTDLLPQGGRDGQDEGPVDESRP